MPHWLSNKLLRLLGVITVTAIVGFLLVIFTYLGVSYLLPGLHSYA